MSFEIYTANTHVFASPNGNSTYIVPQEGQQLFIDALVDGSTGFPDVANRSLLFKDDTAVIGTSDVFYEKTNGSLFAKDLKGGTVNSVKNIIGLNGLPISYNSLGTGTNDGYHSFQVSSSEKMTVEYNAVNSLVTHKFQAGTESGPSIEISGNTGKTGFYNSSNTLGISVKSTTTAQLQSIVDTADNTASFSVGPTFNLNGSKAMLAVSDYQNRQNIALAAALGNTKNLISFFESGTGQNFGSIVCNSATSVSYTTTSDARLKLDIMDLPNCLKIVLGCTPRTFKWKSNGMNDFGFIAQELKNVVPAAVHEPIDNSYMSVDSSKLVPFLVGAIKELNDTIKSMQAELVEINKDLDDVYDRLEKLEA